jgi:Cytochrome c554 and c-prime
MRKTTIIVALGMAVVALAALNVAAGDHAYVGAEKCKMCHKVQYNSWLETTHAKATDVAKASTDPAFEAKCLGCHATNSDESLAGVQCEACHGPGADFKKMSIMKDRDAAVANGLQVPTQAMCDGCHQDNGHSKAVVLADNKTNKAAVHEFKNPPAE